MARPHLIRSDRHPYHVTSRCNNKSFFPIPLEAVWQIMLNQLQGANQKYGLAIHAFVLMGNHFHLLCHTPGGNLDLIMHSILRNTSVIINRNAGSINHLWGGRYRWSLIDSQTHYYHVYRYIFQNPLRAGIVDKVENYPFSSWNKDLPFAIHSFVPVSFGGVEGELQWLNDFYPEEAQKLIRLGLRKSSFDINVRKLKVLRPFLTPKGT